MGITLGTKLAIIGGGNGAHTMAADWVLRGYQVRMYEQPAFMEQLVALEKTRTIQATGVLEANATIDFLTCDMNEALRDTTYIAVVAPAFAHEAIAKQMQGIVSKEQVLLLYPGAFGSLVFKNILGEDCPVIAETNNLPYDTRLTGPCKVHCTGMNPINIAFFPAEAAQTHIEELRKLHDFVHVYQDVLECGLSLVNPSVHSGPCLINIGMIEQPSRGAFHMYEHFTPGAAKIDIAIDEERKAIGRAFGYTLRPLEDFSNKPAGHQINWKELYMQMHGDVALTQISGPASIWNRYLTEDCPNGLVPWASLGRLCGVKTPTMDAIVNIYSLVHERDWWSIGVTAQKLGIENMQIDQIKHYLRTGHMAARQRRYKGVAFDMDHTLYDRKQTYRNLLPAYRREFAQALLPAYMEDDELFLSALLRADYKGVYNGGWRGIYAAMLETGIFKEDIGYERLSTFVQAHYPGAMVIYPDVVQTATWLKAHGYKTGIITNGPSPFQRSKVEAIHGGELFEHVLVSIESGAEKPDAAPFQKMASMMDIASEELLFVGDDPCNDIDGARRAGCTPVWMRSVDIWLDEFAPPQYAIQSIGELPALLQTLCTQQGTSA